MLIEQKTQNPFIKFAKNINLCHNFKIFFSQILSYQFSVFDKKTIKHKLLFTFGTDCTY